MQTSEKRRSHPPIDCGRAGLLVVGPAAAGLGRGEPRVRDRRDALEILALGGCAGGGIIVPVDLLAATLRDGAQEPYVAIAHGVTSSGCRSAIAAAMIWTSGGSVNSR